MRYHLFLHYGWFFQNLGKEAVRTFMHTTVMPNYIGLLHMLPYFKFTGTLCAQWTSTNMATKFSWRHLLFFILAAYSKLYIPSTIKTQINLVPSRLWADFAGMVVLDISTNFLKYPSFEGVFHVLIGKTNLELNCLYIFCLKSNYQNSEKTEQLWSIIAVWVDSLCL